MSGRRILLQYLYLLVFTIDACTPLFYTDSKEKDYPRIGKRLEARFYGRVGTLMSEYGFYFTDNTSEKRRFAGDDLNLAPGGYRTAALYPTGGELQHADRESGMVHRRLLKQSRHMNNLQKIWKRIQKDLLEPPRDTRKNVTTGK